LPPLPFGKFPKRDQLRQVPRKLWMKRAARPPRELLETNNSQSPALIGDFRGSTYAWKVDRSATRDEQNHVGNLSGAVSVHRAGRRLQSEKRQQYLSSLATASPTAPAEGQSVSASLHDSALDRNAGSKPEQLPEGTVPSLDKQIRHWLLDPDSLIYDSWGELQIGKSPGGNPAWTITVTYRFKNAHGAYMGNVTCTYWLREDGTWMLKPGSVSQP
jgi:hypothetical protein